MHRVVGALIEYYNMVCSALFLQRALYSALYKYNAL